MKVARTKLFWAIWAIVVIAVIWWFAHAASASQHIWVVRPSLQSPKGQEQAVPSRITLPISIIVQPTDPDVKFFSATAYNEYGESDFSNEISLTNSSNDSFVTLGWDRSTTTNVNGYKIYSGWYSRQYTNVYDAETNLSLVVPIYGWPLTNWIITVTVTNGATNIAQSSTVYGPWTNLNSITWISTNPISPLFFRGIVKDGRIIEPGPTCRKLNPHLFASGGVCEIPVSSEISKVDTCGVGATDHCAPSRCRSTRPSRRIRQNSKPLSNCLETEFGNYLHSVNWSGNGIYEQAITVRLANGLRYTPDWIVFREGIPWCYEVKGKHVWDDSIAKLKMAASKYREWKWVLVWKEKGSWQTQDVLP